MNWDEVCRPQSCSVHREETLSMYCRACKLLICPECIMNHNQHEVTGLVSFVKTLKDRLAQKEELLVQERNRLQDLSGQLQSVVRDFKQIRRQVIKSTQQTFQAKVDAIMKGLKMLSCDDFAHEALTLAKDIALAQKRCADDRREREAESSGALSKAKTLELAELEKALASPQTGLAAELERRVLALEQNSRDLLGAFHRCLLPQYAETDPQRTLAELKTLRESVLKQQADIKAVVAKCNASETNIQQSLQQLTQQKAISHVVHNDVACSTCNHKPIVGVRYKCDTCPSYNMCENCIKTKGHPHSMLIIEGIWQPSSKPEAKPPQELAHSVIHSESKKPANLNAELLAAESQLKPKVGTKEKFKLTLRARNIGSVPWPEDTRLVPLNDNVCKFNPMPMGTLQPEELKQVQVDLEAPGVDGKYIMTFGLRSKELFGSVLKLVLTVGEVSENATDARDDPIYSAGEEDLSDREGKKDKGKAHYLFPLFDRNLRALKEMLPNATEAELLQSLIEHNNDMSAVTATFTF